MLNFRKARQALSEIRTMHIGSPQNDPKTWDLALGLEAAVVELEQRLDRIEHNQKAILQQLSRLR